MKDHELYRPSNGTEGDAFMGKWCAACQFNGIDEHACEIQLAALCEEVDAPAYPSEWQYRGGLPVCTGFADKGNDVPTYRCDLTPDMFAEAS